MNDEARPLKENDEGSYKGKSVRLLFPADPLKGWIAVELKGSGGGHRRTGNRVHVEDVTKFRRLVLRPPRRREKASRT